LGGGDLGRREKPRRREIEKPRADGEKRNWGGRKALPFIF
jgi:hypothetical protein